MIKLHLWATSWQNHAFPDSHGWGIGAGWKEPSNGVLPLPRAYFPSDSSKEFDNDYTIADWLMGYSPVDCITYVPRLPWTYAFCPGRRGEKGQNPVRR